jgi:hypothetical protein
MRNNASWASATMEGNAARVHPQLVTTLVILTIQLEIFFRTIAAVTTRPPAILPKFISLLTDTSVGLLSDDIAENRYTTHTTIDIKAIDMHKPTIAVFCENVAKKILDFGFMA